VVIEELPSSVFVELIKQHLNLASQHLLLEWNPKRDYLVSIFIRIMIAVWQYFPAELVANKTCFSLYFVVFCSKR
jgi:hypothetical protein